MTVPCCPLPNVEKLESHYLSSVHRARAENDHASSGHQRPCCRGGCSASGAGSSPPSIAEKRYFGPSRVIQQYPPSSPVVPIVVRGGGDRKYFFQTSGR